MLDYVMDDRFGRENSLLVDWSQLGLAAQGSHTQINAKIQDEFRLAAHEKKEEPLHTHQKAHHIVVIVA